MNTKSQEIIKLDETYNTTQSSKLGGYFFRTVESFKSTVNSVEVSTKIYRPLIINVNLKNADLRGADLRRTNLNNANLNNSCYNNYTLFDKNFDPVAAGMREVAQFQMCS
ncbi:MAG: pentapeptide repeat-containing protein [Cyanobacteria bacterium J06621_15]